jgi:hypothetical protein
MRKATEKAIRKNVSVFKRNRKEITGFNIRKDVIERFKRTAFELTKTERGRSVVAEAMMQYCEDNKEDFKQFFYCKPNPEGDKK